MRQLYYRFFGGLLTAQEAWLNKMAASGHRLVRTGRLSYEFEECRPNAVTYRVEFIGKKSKEAAADYHDFLESLNYTVFYQGINLNYSLGKARWRPWAEPGGRVATNGTTFHRELLIVERANDGTPFSLHTSYVDQAAYTCRLRRPWLFLALQLALVTILSRSVGFGALFLLSLVPVTLYHRQIMTFRRKAALDEGCT